MELRFSKVHPCLSGLFIGLCVACEMILARRGGWSGGDRLHSAICVTVCCLCLFALFLRYTISDKSAVHSMDAAVVQPYIKHGCRSAKSER